MSYDDAEFPKLMVLKDQLRVTRHLNRQVTCGACKFKCCNSHLFAVELTPDESEKFKLPIVFPQNGHCSQLTETGCKHSPDRPAFCHIFPIYIKDDGAISTTFWVLTQCPTVRSWEFLERRGNAYVYVPRRDLKGPLKGNMQDELVADKPIEEWPNILENGAKGFEMLFGQDRLEKARADLAKLNKKDGFGL